MYYLIVLLILTLSGEYILAEQLENANQNCNRDNVEAICAKELNENQNFPTPPISIPIKIQVIPYEKAT